MSHIGSLGQRLSLKYGNNRQSTNKFQVESDSNTSLIYTVEFCLLHHYIIPTHWQAK